MDIGLETEEELIDLVTNIVQRKMFKKK